ncbi:hypothetical protein Mapa_016605 [Marchantia paleacea]|nr:hypothetical protein Mapa_016605 [Marchantia paleacea]
MFEDVSKFYPMESFKEEFNYTKVLGNVSIVLQRALVGAIHRRAITLGDASWDALLFVDLSTWIVQIS